FVHDWANPENTRRSWDMVARYVVPQINGYLDGLRTSREFVADNREYFNRAREAVMAKITENPAAAAALKVTKSPLLTASAANVPDLGQTPDGRTGRWSENSEPAQARNRAVLRSLPWRAGPWVLPAGDEQSGTRRGRQRRLSADRSTRTEGLLLGAKTTGAAPSAERPLTRERVSRSTVPLEL